MTQLTTRGCLVFFSFWLVFDDSFVVVVGCISSRECRLLENSKTLHVTP
jgi:hypothetical protein